MRVLFSPTFGKRKVNAVSFLLSFVRSLFFLKFISARDQAGLETSVCTDEFMIDTTPPSTGTIELDTFVMSNWVKDSIFSVSLGEFIDDESSTIDKYITFLGSSWFRADIIQEREYDRNVVEINLEEAGVIDGHTYYLGAKVGYKWGC